MALTMYYVKHRVCFTDAKPAVKGIINWCRVFFPFRSLFCIEKGFRPLVMEVTDWQHLGAKFLFAVFKGVYHNASLQVWFESCVYLPLFDESDSGSLALGKAKLVIRIAKRLLKLIWAVCAK